MNIAIHLLIALTFSAFTAVYPRNCYVHPTKPSLAAVGCEGSSEPCHTLGYYSQNYSFMPETALIFLPGDHYLTGETLTLNDISNITLTSLQPEVNIITYTNGSIHCENVSNLKIEGLNFHFDLTLTTTESSGLRIFSAIGVFIISNTFQGTQTLINFIESHANISNCTFQKSKNSAIKAVWKNSIKISECIFSNNEGTGNGGAIYIVSSAIILAGNYFSNNSDSCHGGAVSCSSCSLELSNRNVFINNSANCSGSHSVEGGGAIYASGSSEVVVIGFAYFLNNSAIAGGAIHLYQSKMRVKCGEVKFEGNTAFYRGGGGIYVQDSILRWLPLPCVRNVTFKDNSAQNNGDGGAIYMDNREDLSAGSFQQLWIFGIFLHNTAKQGGAIYADSVYRLYVWSSVFKNNSFTALAVHNIVLELTFRRTTRFMYNLGGALEAEFSSVHFSGHTMFSSNTGDNGAALGLLQGELHFSGPTIFHENKANKDGGAIYATGTIIYINDTVSFTLNKAGRHGGAIYLDTLATLKLKASMPSHELLITTANFAQQSGGAIYFVDTPTPNQCLTNRRNMKFEMKKVPQCFLHVNGCPYSPKISSRNDTAGSGNGHFLFGGLLNKCRLRGCDQWWMEGIIYFFARNIVSTHPTNRSGKVITSKPYELCLCDKRYPLREALVNCKKITSVTVYRGQQFNVSILAAAQIKTTSTFVSAFTSSTSRLEASQTTQFSGDGCQSLSYTIYSTENNEEIKLYADGPCRDVGDANVIVNATILSCPDGFAAVGDICSCENRLEQFSINCVINNTPYFVKAESSNFWMGKFLINETYNGLILASSCPLEYCKPDSIQFTLDDLDSQCDHNRAGLVCGACAGSHSLMLGGSYCRICSNSHLALILPFALMGIVLVAFLTFLRITVVTGVLNSIILYSNILQTTRNSLLPFNTRNILTVFLSWMNLDFGFQTCFYNGLDAYQQTWLQMVFPLYVWLLIGTIIFISRYSITVSKVIGHNPIAVLATLILMSYMKILKIIVEVYSSMELYYPVNSTVTVWLKDANVPYLQTQHLGLTIVITLILVFFFLPYTLLLLLGHELFRFTGRRYFGWLDKIKPLLEAYHAPYRVRTRYWTGLLLLVRCALYVIFLRFSQSSNKTFMALNITFCILGFTLGIVYAGRIYRKAAVNVVEVFIYLNLIVLSATAQASLNSEQLVYSLISLVFVLLIVTCVYQFHVLYIAKTEMWLKVKQIGLRYLPKKHQRKQTAPVVPNPSQDPYRIVTKTVIELREPLIETATR